MTTISVALNSALERHRSGDLEEAARLYREILASNARQPDAWHLLGLIDYARGNYAPAIEHIRRAILLDGAQASFHNHLGEALLAAGFLPEAEASCRRGLALEADFAIGHNTLGTVLAARGALDEAIASYRRAIALAPQFAQAHYNLGLGLEAQEAFAEAESSYRHALAAKANYSLALHALGRLLQRQRRFEDAVACYRQLLTLAPNDAATLCNLASALKDQDRFDEALQNYDRALAIEPQLAEAHFNQAVIHQARQQHTAAEAAYRRAILARPRYPEALSNLGTICKLQGRLGEAMECYERALAVDDTLAEPHRNRALLRLLTGNFADGWREYEWRRRVPGLPRTSFSQPQWQGQPMPGQTLLLVAEQGLGDTLQFVRYAALAKKQNAARVLLHAPQRLHGLLSSVAGVDQFLSGDVTQPFDAYLPLLSAPAVFGTTLETVPADVPYLVADAERVAHWQRELASNAGFKVAIAWQGNPAYEDDARRSVPLAAFAPLADLPDVRLFSLQKQHGLEQLAALAGRLRIVDLGPRLDEGGDAFVDTAAVMKNMDLVVTSDT
ncbi:MAG: tetratricopeptide repeat protein, partial [Pirellulales bacterium]